MHHTLTSRPQIVTALLALAGASAPVSSAQVAASPLSLQRLGVPDSFGPGLVALSATRVELHLTRPAHVVLLWVAPDGGIELHFPLRSRDRSERRAGRHALSVSDVPSPIEPPVLTGAPSSSEPGRLPSTGTTGMLAGRPTGDTAIAGYWVLVTAAMPLPAADVRRRLAPLAREGAGAPEVLEQIPERLVGRFTTLWAAYIAPVALR